MTVLGWAKSEREEGPEGVMSFRGFVVEPYAALREVTEAERAAGRDAHHAAAGAVPAPAQRMGERIPVVEVADDRHRTRRLVGGQYEGNANDVVAARPGRFDQLISPLRIVLSRGMPPSLHHGCFGAVSDVQRRCEQTGCLLTEIGRCAGPRRLIRPFQVTSPSRARLGKRVVRRWRAMVASSRASDAPRQ